LFDIKFTDLAQVGGNWYLQVKTIKTGSFVRIKLPNYVIVIIRKFESTARGRKAIFPPIPRTRFNNQLKLIAKLAGWTNMVRRERSQWGMYHTSAGINKTTPRNFCDLVSSHIMRRTAITTMLMLGMKEPAVKKISGHADNSKHFYRYVNLVQSYLDNEVDVVFEKLLQMR
jgi:integrase